MIFKKFVHALSFLFLLGAGLLTFFLILSGGRSDATLSRFYWFEADTSGFNDAPGRTRWYNYQWCGSESGQSVGCSSRMAAQPFSPRDNFGRSDEMPGTFLSSRDTYYYLSRVAWAMLLIGLFSIVLTIIPAIVTIFKTFTPIAVWLNVGHWTSLFFILLAACLYTGCYAKAKVGFDGRDRYSKLGPRNFAFVWTSVFLLLLDAIWAAITLGIHGKNKYKDYARETGAYGGGFHNGSSSTDTHMDKSTFNSEKPPRNRTFFTKLKTKRKLMQSPSHEQGEPADEVQYVTRDYVAQPQPVNANNTTATTAN